MKKVKIGLIGCGAFSHAQHLPNIKNNSYAELKWICDINEEVLKKTQQEYNVPNITTNIQDVVTDKEIDLIILATTHDVHLSGIKAAAENKKHILCEKPLSPEINEGLEILKIIRKNNVKLAVDYNRRMAPSLISLKKKYLDFKKNPVYQPWRYTETKRELFREEKNTSFLIRIQDESLSYRLVHLDLLKGGGMIIAETCHWLDLLSWFYEEEPVEIQAWGSSLLSHGINLTFRSGNTGTIIFNTGGSFDYPKEMYEITYNGTLFRNEYFLENQIYGPKDSLTEYFDLQRNPDNLKSDKKGLAQYMERLKNLRNGNQNIKEKWNLLSVDKGHQNLLDSFIDAIINDKESPCDETDGFRATYLSKLAIESIRTKKVLPVEMKYWYPVVN